MVANNRLLRAGKAHSMQSLLHIIPYYSWLVSIFNLLLKFIVADSFGNTLIVTPSLALQLSLLICSTLTGFIMNVISAFKCIFVTFAASCQAVHNLMLFINMRLASSIIGLFSMPYIKTQYSL